MNLHNFHHDFIDGEARVTLYMGDCCGEYRCNNRHFWLSAHNCQVSTPTSQNLELEQQIRIFGADRLINSLNDWNVHFLICRSINQKMQILRMLGWGLTIHAGWGFFFLSLWMYKCLETANDQHFWNHGVVSYAMIPRCLPNIIVFSHRHI
jgi:hypothetical protein